MLHPSVRRYKRTDRAAIEAGGIKAGTAKRSRSTGSCAGDFRSNENRRCNRGKKMKNLPYFRLPSLPDRTQTPILRVEAVARIWRPFNR
ncbi:MAG: hypothetical protein AAGF82_04230, partial [Pseudomonadota bacterium]